MSPTASASPGTAATLSRSAWPHRRVMPIVLALALVSAEGRVTYQDDVLPLVETHCSRCHNPDKNKGDLDLTSFPALLRGGGSGKVVLPGRPEESVLYGVISHAREPYMPPRKPRLPDEVLQVFEAWIAGGLLETSRSKSLLRKGASVDLTLEAASAGRPEGAPPMPGPLSLEPVVHTRLTTASTGLAASPWAPLLALAGQKQVLLYHTDTFELLGILPFPNGQPVDLEFSPNGALLLAGGGQAARQGHVVIWEVATGQRLVTLGREKDAVLATDISADHRWVAVGGTDRLVKIYEVATGEEVHRLEQHTDWILDLAFSPAGGMLATGDRTGGISVWDPANGSEVFRLDGHREAVTGLAFRDDGKVLASSGEDGAIKLWSMQDGRQARSWTAHPGGVMTVGFAHDGRLISCGRDKKTRLWNGDGNKIRSFYLFGELPVRAVLSHDGNRLFASDFDGRLAAWDAREDKIVQEMETNPLPLKEQIAEAREELASLERGDPKPSRRFQRAVAALQQAEAEKVQAQAWRDAAHQEKVLREQAVEDLKKAAARPNPPSGIARKLATARAVRNKARQVAAEAENELRVRTKAVGSVREEHARLEALEDPEIRLGATRERLARLSLARSQSALVQARHRLAEAQRSLRQLQQQEKLLAEAIAQARAELENDGGGESRGQLEQELDDLEGTAREVARKLRRTEGSVAEAREEVEELTAAHEKLKAATLASLSSW